MDASDQHAEVAVLALTAALVLGAAALAGIIVRRKGGRLPGWLTALIMFLALISTAAMVWTASLGGKIRHPEVLRIEPSQRSSPSIVVGSAVPARRF